MDIKHVYREKIKVVYYTHPLCFQSLRMAPAWHRLLEEFSAILNVYYSMLGPGMLPGPLDGFATASQRNSMLPCLAVKAVSLQSSQVAGMYLDLLRQASMGHKRDICSLDVLVDLARQISKSHPGRLDLNRFGKDLYGRASRYALKEDQDKARLNQISNCPTLTFTFAGKGVKLSGEVGYEQLAGAVRKLFLNTLCGSNP